MSSFSDQAIVEALEERIGYVFAQKELALEALTHGSYVKEAEDLSKASRLRDYDRLEFLGDAVLELCTSQMLMTRYDWQEGRLTKARASIVCEASLSEAAQRLGLGELMRLGVGEERNGGRERASLLCDVFEAVVGAVYTDCGFDKETAYRLLDRLLYESLTIQDIQEFDAKSYLQEYLQQKGQKAPVYELLESRGPVHDPVFIMGLYINGQLCASGEGSSKQRASQQAAKAYLGKIRKSST